MSDYLLPDDFSLNWNGPELNGRWTKNNSLLPVDISNNFNEIHLHIINHHPVLQNVNILYGEQNLFLKMSAGQSYMFILDASYKYEYISINSAEIRPCDVSESQDKRSLGVFVVKFSYV